MNIFKPLFCSLIIAGLTLPIVDWAQDTTGIKAKAKLVREIKLPNRNLSTSIFGNYNLADSFSKRKDSARAGEYFLKVDPYYILYLGQTAGTIDTFFTRFYLPEAVKKEYKEHFATAYKAPKQLSYETLKAMHKETLQLKYRLDTSMRMKSYFEEQLHITDSIHFAYLFEYVTKKGWPRIEDGSLYAAEIAIRDIGHSYDYVPVMDKAFSTGQLPLRILTKNFYNTFYFTTHYSLANAKKRQHDTYDISIMLDGEMPRNMEAIITSIKSHAPLKDLLLIHEDHIEPFNRKPEERWWGERFGKKFNDDVGTFVTFLKVNCPAKDDCRLFYPYPSDYRKKRLILYLVYE